MPLMRDPRGGRFLISPVFCISHVAPRRRIGRIDDEQQQRRFERLGKRGSKRRDEIVRQLAPTQRCAGISRASRPARRCAEGAQSASLRSRATRNATFLLALILMGSPVAGLRPVRAARFLTWRIPSPLSLTLAPFFMCLPRRRSRRRARRPLGASAAHAIARAERRGDGVGPSCPALRGPAAHATALEVFEKGAPVHLGL